MLTLKSDCALVNLGAAKSGGICDQTNVGEPQTGKYRTGMGLVVGKPIWVGRQQSKMSRVPIRVYPLGYADRETLLSDEVVIRCPHSQVDIRPDCTDVLFN